MYCLNKFCCICFCYSNDLNPISSRGNKDKSIYMKLITTIPEMCFDQMNNQRLVCRKCSRSIDSMYRFRKKCLRSKANLLGYIAKLESTGCVSGAVCVNLIDFRQKSYIKLGSDCFKLTPNLENDKPDNNKEDSAFGNENNIIQSNNVGSNEINVQVEEEKSVENGKIVENSNLQNVVTGPSTSQYSTDGSQNSATESNMRVRKKKRECKICHKKFSGRTTLMFHMHVHTGERVSECTVCHKKFSKNSQLASHMLKHTQDKIYKCVICKKAFHDEKYLKIHQIGHAESAIATSRDQETLNQLTPNRNFTRRIS